MRRPIGMFVLVLMAMAGLIAPASAQDQGAQPQQVNVTVKIVEFQAAKGVETGLSAYFARRNKVRLYNRLTSGNGAIKTADLTFPLDSEGAITVFLDRIRMGEGDLEFVLQALARESRARVLSRPELMVMVGGAAGQIKTVRKVPYEDAVVVGNTPITVTKFRDTGVMLNVSVPTITDDDGNWATTEDTYIQLNVNAEVNEVGTDIVVSNAGTGGSSVSAPTFSNRSIKTQVWVRHGQVLILGGLYRNRKSKELDTVPWLSGAESVAVGAAERLVPGDVLPENPLSSVVGNRKSESERRELVFIIKTETWLPSYTVADEYGFAVDEAEGDDGRFRPTEVITGVVEGIAEIPKGIAEGISGESLETELGSATEGVAE